MIPALAQSASTAVNVKPVGMSATAYIMLVFVLVSVPLMAGILRQLIKNQPELKKLETEDDASLRGLLLARIEKLEAKVDQNEADCLIRIETAIRTNDVRWETQLAKHKLESDQRITELEGELRQILQQGQSAGQIISLGIRAPAVSSKLAGIEE